MPSCEPARIPSPGQGPSAVWRSSGVAWRRHADLRPDRDTRFIETPDGRAVTSASRQFSCSSARLRRQTSRFHDGQPASGGEPVGIDHDIDPPEADSQAGPARPIRQLPRRRTPRPGRCRLIGRARGVGKHRRRPGCRPRACPLNHRARPRRTTSRQRDRLRHVPIPRPGRPADDHPSQPETRRTRASGARVMIVCMQTLVPNPQIPTFIRTSSIIRMPQLCDFLNAPIARMGIFLDSSHW